MKALENSKKSAVDEETANLRKEKSELAAKNAELDSEREKLAKECNSLREELGIARSQLQERERVYQGVSGIGREEELQLKTSLHETKGKYQQIQQQLSEKVQIISLLKKD